MDTVDTTSPRMAQLVKTWALRHHVDLARRGACLILSMPGRTERWMIYHYEDGRVSVTRFLVFEDRRFALDLDLVFEIHPLGWEPVELLYDPDLWTAYVQEAEASGIPVYDERGETRFAGFTEYVAQQIEAEGWPEQSYQQLAAGWTRCPAVRVATMTSATASYGHVQRVGKRCAMPKARMITANCAMTAG